MQIDTEVKNVGLPEDHPLAEPLTDQERALYWSTVQESADVSAKVLEYEKHNGGFVDEDPKLANLQSRLEDALLLSELIEEVAALRINRTAAKGGEYE